MSIFLKEKDRQSLDRGFWEQFGAAPERYFSAPGRTELGGNHTDHQQGCVLAAAVDLDMLGAVRENGSNQVCICSEGYPLCRVSLEELTPRKEEQNTTISLIRGVLARFAQLGACLRGFDAYIRSTVLPGSGLSSSAAFEVLLGTICNGLFPENALPMTEIAKIGQYAENVYFGKPCGLMDQMASAVGNLVFIDFEKPEQPEVLHISFDFSVSGHALCIIDTGASHADLTEEYAAIPAELKEICTCFGARVLRQVPERDFYSELPKLRQKCGDRAVLRAIHFYEENRRAKAQAEALSRGDFKRFLQLVRASGQSSWMYLQNVIPGGSALRQDMAIALAMCHKLLGEQGAFRVHGGGFAGAVQAFVPLHMLDAFCKGMDEVLGEGACHALNIRSYGGREMEKER